AGCRASACRRGSSGGRPRRSAAAAYPVGRDRCARAAPRPSVRASGGPTLALPKWHSRSAAFARSDATTPRPLEVAPSSRAKLDLPEPGLLGENRSMRFLVPAAMAVVAAGAAASPPASTGAVPREGVVLLELFTPQGCSSCPPADRVLSALGQDESLRERVVPLAFHVDYWDRIGWTDPFGSSRWSARQEAYGRRFRLDGVYTPQLVLDGRAEMNGSQEARIRAEIARGLERLPVARVDLAAARGEGAAEAVITVGAEMLEARDGKLDLLLAVFEN